MGHNGNLPPSMRLTHLWPVADQVELLKHQQIENLLTRPLEELTDPELDALIAHLDRELGHDLGAMIDSLPDDKLRALADGDMSLLSEDERALALRYDQTYWALGGH